MSFFWAVELVDERWKYISSFQVGNLAIVIFILFGIFQSIFLGLEKLTISNFSQQEKKIEFEQLLKFERIFTFANPFENPTKCIK